MGARFTRQATEEQAELANQAYQEMQYRYKAMRQALLTFLTAFADTKLTFQQYAGMLLSSAVSESSTTLAALIDRGYSLLQETAGQARKMLQDQGSLPVVDAIRVNAVDIATDTFSRPLLPLVPIEDSERLSALAAQLLTCMCELEGYEHEQG